MPESLRPSKKQRELLTFLDGFIKGHGYGPSYREIMRALNYKSVSTVASHIDHLIAKGFVTKSDNSARSLEVIDSDATFKPKTLVTKTDEKWLIKQVTERFESYDAEPTKKSLDDLYVLVGALHVLGFDEAATSFKAKLPHADS